MTGKKPPIKSVGIFGGTFDPIHLGHLNLAISLQEQENLDEVWFCPAQLSPHKLNSKPSDPSHRLAMLKIAIQSHKSFKILDWELNRPPPSYSIKTINLLFEDSQLKNNHYFLLLSDDAFKHFHQWHHIEKIIKKLPLLVGSRYEGFNPNLSAGNPAVSEALRLGIRKTLLMEISSSLIRERLKKGLYCEHLLPQKVLDYIYQNHLYST